MTLLRSNLARSPMHHRDNYRQGGTPLNLYKEWNLGRCRTPRSVCLYRFPGHPPLSVINNIYKYIYNIRPQVALLSRQTLKYLWTIMDKCFFSNLITIRDFLVHNCP
jgi:hypothetical protein